MIHLLIKFEQDMVLDTLGVNKVNRLSLSNYSLKFQIFFINLLIALFGFIFFILFNIYLIQNDKNIISDYEYSKKNLLSVKNFLEKNSIVRVPLFDDTCKGLDVKNCLDANELNNNLELSEPVLEPTITQQYILQNYLSRVFEVKIYNDDWIKIVDTQDYYNFSNVEESDLTEPLEIESGVYQEYSQFFQNLFRVYYQQYIKNKFIDNLENQKSDIVYVAEIIRKKHNIDKKFLDTENNIYQLFAAPIIFNESVYGVILISYPIINNQTLEVISFNLFNFYILFVLIMIALSFIFSRGLIRPIKKLSNLTILERDKVIKNKIEYPQRGDEIGILSNEIKNMSLDLKSQISQLEKFAADVSHELKNPLTSLQSASELLLNKKVSDQNKMLLIQNIDKDIKRMNQLITDISNFTRIKAEIELEQNEYLNLNHFLYDVSNYFADNNKKIKIFIEEKDQNISVLVNKNKLLQVFINIIENSISIAGNNSQILIEISIHNKSNVQVKIYDQGKGIFLTDKEKIFERFYSDRTIDKDQHTGLGLSIAKEIILSFKGLIKLTVSDKKNYSGACFVIILPIRTIGRNEQ